MVTQHSQGSSPKGVAGKTRGTESGDRGRRKTWGVRERERGGREGEGESGRESKLIFVS